MNDNEYAIVCTLALGKLFEQHMDILGRIRLRHERFTPVPPELSEDVARIIRNAKAVESVCVIKHPSDISELFQIVTDGIQRTYEIK